MNTGEIKRRNGQFFTQGNPFQHKAFQSWAESSDISNHTILEPFAGENSLIDHLEGMGLCNNSSSYDIHPSDERVERRDTLESFPKGFDICVTNPPWLARNSATIRGFEFTDCGYDDLYKFALEKCLQNCDWVAALVPESFICAHIFHERLTDFISLNPDLFTDTGHPVGLALFNPLQTDDVKVWFGDSYISTLSNLELLRPQPLPDGPIVRFNEPLGNVGLIALDNTKEASIRFCQVEELADYQVKKTGRHITKLHVDGEVRIKRWNEYLDDFRDKTRDVLMTCYKGIRKDGKYRRRLDWKLARGIIHRA